MIVADTNVLAYLVLASERTASARRARARDADWRIPVWWRAEFLNILASMVRRGGMPVNEASTAWQTALLMVRGRERHPGEARVLKTAIIDRVTAYDAWFLALADDLDVPLVTADRRLVAARPDRAILLEDFAAGAPPAQDGP